MPTARDKMPEEYISEVLSFYYTERWWALDVPARTAESESIKSKLKAWRESSKALKAETYGSLRGDSDLIFWLMCKDPRELLVAKLMLEESLSGLAHFSQGLLSVYSEAAEKRQQGGDYFVAYPMSKTPDWYLLDKEESKRIVADHVNMAINSRHNNGIISCTTKSFGIADHEFVVIYEMPSLYEWVKVTEELRSATARKWITRETPILTGIRI